MTGVVARSFTVQPESQAVSRGQTATFHVEAENAAAYLWQEDDGSGFATVADGGIYSGAATSTLTVQNVNFAMEGYRYRAGATLDFHPILYSESATLTVAATSPDAPQDVVAVAGPGCPASALMGPNRLN